MNDGTIALVLMLCYLVLALFVGLLAARGRARLSVTDFAVADRGLGVVVMWFLMGGTVFSAFAFLGGPGWAFSMGAASLYILAYVSLGMLPWYVIGPRLARIGRERSYLTMGDFVRDHYRGAGGDRLARVLVVVMGVVALGAFVQYLTLQLKGVAYIFNVMTSGMVPFWLGALLAYGIVIAYVATGGVRAAAWSDVLQGALLLLVAWVVGIWLAFRMHDGPTEMFRAIDDAKEGFLTIGHEGSMMGPVEFSTITLVSVIGFLMWPHLFMKSFTTTERRIKQVVVTYPLFALFIIPVLFIGFAGVTTVAPADLGASDEILPYLVTEVLPLSGLAFGLIGAGALSAAMSSADAITHGASVTLARDVVRPLRPTISEPAQVWLMRAAVVLVGAFAYWLAVAGAESLVQLLVGAYGAVVQFAPAVYGAMFWRRATAAGALSGLVVGVAVNVWFQFEALGAASKPFGINEGILGLIANVAVFVVVSLLTAGSLARPAEPAERHEPSEQNVPSHGE